MEDAHRLRDVQRGIPLGEGTSPKRPNAAQRSLSGAAVASEAVILIAKAMCTTPRPRRLRTSQDASRYQ